MGPSAAWFYEGQLRLHRNWNWTARECDGESELEHNKQNPEKIDFIKLKHVYKAADNKSTMENCLLLYS